LNSKGKQAKIQSERTQKEIEFSSGGGIPQKVEVLFKASSRKNNTSLLRVLYYSKTV
jgi:hypothetical protein